MSTLELQEIDSSEFERHSNGGRSLVVERPQLYAKFYFPGSSESIAIGWRSDLVAPILLHTQADVVWLGFDEVLACFRRKRLFLLICCPFPVTQILHHHTLVVVVATCLLYVLSPDAILLQLISLPSIIDGVAIRDREIVVTVLEGEVYKYTV
jgi:hypothetical protein